ncbi:MAG: RHS repeat-associated core domain-containing protein [Methylococcaceae bacterium]|jgi:RHS repeat-associated protein
MTGDGNLTYTYNQTGQLAQVSQDGAVIARYAYDYQGRRTQKTVNGSTTLFFYDQDGHLLAEASTNGALQKSYLWQADTPLTVIDSTGSQDQPYYLQADPLNSPRAARNQAGTVVWAWPQDAFGSNPANPDPDGNGQTTQINLRFPGQYYDAETGLHYNWNRYYDPNTGRYISVDPIGLQGGSNPYAYVEGNPVNYIDPNGLDATLSLPGSGSFTFPRIPIPNPALVCVSLLTYSSDYSPEQKTCDEQPTQCPYQAKEVPKSALGPSGKPKIHNVDHPNRKSAKDAARNDGQGPPMHHPSLEVGGPHYHPTDADGNKIPGVHHNY